MQASDFLLEILKDPNSPALQQLYNFINTNYGFNSFLDTLKNNNSLSFIFLKQYSSSWIKSGTMKMLYSEDFISFLIHNYKSFKKQNQFCIIEYLGVLSMNNLVSLEIVNLLIQQQNWECIEKIFEKYRVLPRSNELFREIIQNIEVISPSLNQIFHIQPILHKQEINLNNKKKIVIDNETASVLFNTISPPILNIFYSLVFQDIHPFFEDNVECFFQIFLILFNKQENMEIINEIFDLFIVKYPELTDFDAVISTLAKIEYLNISCINTLTKAFNQQRIHTNLIINMLIRILENKAYDLYEEDSLNKTRNLLQGNDLERGCLYKLIQLCQPDIYLFKNENILFIASVLKYKDDKVVKFAKNIISSNNSEMALSAFFYLIKIQDYSEYSNINLEYLKNESKFMCIKYLCNFFRTNENFHNKSIIFKYFDQKYLDKNILQEKMGFILNECYAIDKFASEYTSELLFRLSKKNEDLMTNELYQMITTVFNNMNSIFLQPAIYLFDIYISLSLKLKKYNFQLVEYILKNDLTDLYGLCFYYLSIIVSEQDVNKNLILQILQNDAIFSVTELHYSLCFLSISAFRKGIIMEEQICRIYNRFIGYIKIIFLYLLSNYKLSRQAIHDYNYEVGYLLFDEFDQKLFTENYLSPKFTRIILKKILNDANIDKTVAKEMFLKNSNNIEQETFLHSIIVYFDI